MNAPTNCPSTDEFEALFEDELSQEEEVALAEHLESCDPCRRRLERIDRDDGSAEALADLLRAEPTLSGARFQAAIERMKAESPGEDAVDVPTTDALLDFLEPTDDPEHIGRLGRYEVSEFVGRGGMGLVLKGYDSQLKRVVAIKVLAPELASNANARKRFRREGQAAAAVCHDHVVTIHGVDEANGLPHLVMEYISGKSLNGRITAEGPLELKEILRIGMQTAAGLAAAHAQGLVHRDIKPANILLENGVERVKISDFGLARAVDDVRVTQPGVVTGTPEYMSPEQARGEEVDHRSDLFSLGCVLYTMCTARPPFRAENTVGMIRRVCEDTPRPIRQINQEIPDWLVEIVDRLMAKDPDSRIQSATEVGELLSGHLAHLQEPTVNPRPARLAADARRRSKPAAMAKLRPSWLAGAATIVLLLASFGFTETSGITNVTSTVIRLVQGEGVLVIEVDDPEVAVEIDGDQLVITGAGSREIRVPTGVHDVKAFKDGDPVHREVVSVTRGGRVAVRVHVEANSALASQRLPRTRKVWDNSTKRGAPSPNGRFITFTDWETGDLAAHDLVEGKSRRLTNKGEWSESGDFAFFHIWSPDGEEVAYTWCNVTERNGRYDLRRISRNGGKPHVISTFNYLELYAWSPDGTHILAGVSEPDQPNALSLISVEDGSVRRLSDGYPIDASISPDGSYLVYDVLEHEDSEDRDIHIMALKGSSDIPLIAGPGNDYAPLWTPDGKGIVFISDRGGDVGLWIMPIDGMSPAGPAQPTGTDMDLMKPLGFTQDGGYFYGNIVYDANTDVYVSGIDAENAKLAGAPAKLPLRYQGFNGLPGWSPDGERLAYVSRRSQQEKLVIRSIGSGAEQVLIPDFNRLVWIMTRPRWSPDGTAILFCGGSGDQKTVFTVDVQSGEASPLIEPSKELRRPFTATWSSDGERVYYIRGGQARIAVVDYRSGQEQTFYELAPTDPQDGWPMPLAHSLAASRDGQYLALASRRSISIMPAEGGDRKIIANAPEGNQISAAAGIVWTPDSQSVIYATGVPDAGGALVGSFDPAQIWQVDVSGGEPKRLGDEVAGLTCMSLHPDGRQLAFSASSPGQAVPEGIWVLENFLPSSDQ